LPLGSAVNNDFIGVFCGNFNGLVLAAAIRNDNFMGYGKLRFKRAQCAPDDLLLVICGNHYGYHSVMLA